MPLKRTGHMAMSDEERNARRTSIGGSDARILMSGDQRAIENLWLEKRGEITREDLSEMLLAQLGNVTEPLNIDWFEKETGYEVTDEQAKIHHADWEFAHATVDGLVRRRETVNIIGVVECKFIQPFGYTLEKILEKYQPQVQHNMMCADVDRGFLSLILGSGQYVLQEIEANPFYQAALLQAEIKFWECVQSGKTPGTPAVNLPIQERVRVIDMRGNNEWASHAVDLIQTKTASEKHEKAKKAIKKLFPPDAAVAEGHGVKVSLSKDGKVLVNIDKLEIARADQMAA